MDERTANEIKRHFWTWSGGFPPESDDQIYVYIDAARSSCPFYARGVTGGEFTNEARGQAQGCAERPG